MHLECDNDINLIELALLLLLELGDFGIDGLHGLLHELLLLVEGLAFLPQGLGLFLNVCRGIFLVESLLAQVTDLLIERLVAPRGTDFLDVVVVVELVVLEFVVVIFLLFIFSVVVVHVLRLPLDALDLAEKYLQQGLPERV